MERLEGVVIPCYTVRNTLIFPLKRKIRAQLVVRMPQIYGIHVEEMGEKYEDFVHTITDHVHKEKVYDVMRESECPQ